MIHKSNIAHIAANYGISENFITFITKVQLRNWMVDLGAK